jgi:hypothetical protein
LLCPVGATHVFDISYALHFAPVIPLTSLLYVTWHTGTQLPREPDLVWGIIKLFAVGVMYQSVFSLTRHLLAIWPFFLTAGVLIDYMVNLDEMAGVSTQYPWPWLTLTLMASMGVAFAIAGRRGMRSAR